MAYGDMTIRLSIAGALGLSHRLQRVMMRGGTYAEMYEPGDVLDRIAVRLGDLLLLMPGRSAVQMIDDLQRVGERAASIMHPSAPWLGFHRHPASNRARQGHRMSQTHTH